MVVLVREKQACLHIHTTKISSSSPISSFSIPKGTSFLRDMNKGSSEMIVKGHVLGYSTILKSDFRLSSNMECKLSYTWDDRTTHKDCRSTKKVNLVMSK